MRVPVLACHHHSDENLSTPLPDLRFSSAEASHTLGFPLSLGGMTLASLKPTLVLCLFVCVCVYVCVCAHVVVGGRFCEMQSVFSMLLVRSEAERRLCLESGIIKPFAKQQLADGACFV